MLVPGMFTHALNTVERSADSIGENYIEELARQTKHHAVEDFAMGPMLPPLQAMPSNGDDCAKELWKPIPQMFARTPHSASHAHAPNGPAQLNALEPSVTTLSVRSIPFKTSQEDLIALWPPTWGYDFIHLPYSFKQRRPAGYAFLNFISNEAAQRFYNEWEGKHFTTNGRTKALSINAAHLQGSLANLEHLQTQGIGEVLNHKYLPALYYGTDRICFRAVLRELEVMQNGAGVAQLSWSS